MHAPDVWLRLFGEPRFDDGSSVVPLRVPPKAAALAALIVAAPDQPHLRAPLAEALWPDEPADEARANLRRHVHLLRSVLPDDCLTLTRTTVRWNPNAPCSVDVVEFIKASRDVRDYAVAVRLYDGPLCAPVFDDAIQSVRERCAQTYGTMLRVLARAETAVGNRTQALIYLDRSIAHDPLDEAAVRDAMALRFESGDRSGALREYHALAARLQTELDVRPERDTIELYRSFLDAASAATAPHNLRTWATSFVGRERDLDRLQSAIEHHRLVSLVGSGGIGKTRLANELGIALLDRFPDGIWFVPLEDAFDVTAVLDRIDEHARLGAGGERERVLEALRERRALLVLDNCEQVADVVSEIAAAIVAATQTRVLATSRRRLDAPGEYAYALDALALPPLRVHAPGDIAAFPSVRLFLERAVAVEPSLRLTSENANTVAHIVHRLDGVPLAIELVSARANLLTLTGLAKRLVDRLDAFRSRDRDARQSTIEATIAWSYDLLSERERRTLCTAAAFANGWSLEALQAASDDNDVFEPLSELVESSLVQSRQDDGEVRYSMFEATRAFALAHLRASGDDYRVRVLHAAWYAGRAEKLCADERTAREAESYATCDREHPNAMLALEWACREHPSVAVRMANALWRYWRSRSHVRTASSLLKNLLDNDAFEELSLDERARGRFVAGYLAKDLSQYEDATEHLRFAMEAFAESGDRLGEFDATFALAVVAFNMADLERARSYFETCLPMAEGPVDRRRSALLARSLGSIAHELGDLDAAAAHFERALALFRAENDVYGLAFTMRVLAAVELERGRANDAIALGRGAVELYRQLDNQLQLAETLAILGGIYSESGDFPSAQASFTEAFALHGHVAYPWLLVNSLFIYMEHLERIGDLEEAARVDGRAEAVSSRHGGVSLSPRYRSQIEACRRRIERALGTEKYEALGRIAAATA